MRLKLFNNGEPVGNFLEHWNGLVALRSGQQEELLEVLYEGEDALRALAGRNPGDAQAIVAGHGLLKFVVSAAAKQNFSTAQLRGDLDQLPGNAEDFVTKFCELYEKIHPAINKLLSENALYQHDRIVTNVTWRADHVTASDALYELHMPLYRLRLNTRLEDEESVVRFTLTQEALRLLKGALEEMSHLIEPEIYTSNAEEE